MCSFCRQHTTTTEEGQGSLEFLILTSLMLIIAASLFGLFASGNTQSDPQSTMLGRTVLQSPFTTSTNFGISDQGIKNLLEH